MHFSLATIIAVIPLLAWASPIAEQPHTTIPLSKTSNLIKPDGSVNVHKLRIHLDSSIAKILRGIDNYERNTGQGDPIQPDAVSTRRKRDAGKVPLTDDSNELWQGAISVGTPAKLFTVDFDTGSSDLFLPDSTCGTTCSGHTLYNPSASTTAKALGKSFNLTYGDSSNVSGKQYTDTVKIAGLTATAQTLGSATKYSTGFQSANFPADGLMGMAFQSISDYNASPVFQTLVNQGQTTNGVFAFKLASSGSELNVGGLNSALYSGTPTYSSVTQQGYWQIQFSALKVGSSTVVGSTAAIVDSGTTLIIGSTAGVKAFYDKIPGSADASSTVAAGFYTFPCSTTLPAISFTIGGKALSMPASALNFGPISTGSSTCIGSIAASDSIGSEFWILGDSWMRNYYTIFDYDNSRVGFATLQSWYTSSTSP